MIDMITTQASSVINKGNVERNRSQVVAIVMPPVPAAAD